MNLLKNLTVRWVPLISEQLWIYLTVEILWNLLCGREPFSLVGYLLCGAVMVCGNVLFLRRSRPLWAVVCFNLLLCLIWAPLLARTLDRSYPILIWLLVGQFLLPAARGYYHAARNVTVTRLQNCGERMVLYCLLYLIVASFVPDIVHRIPLLVAVLVLDLLAVVLLRTTGRNTVQAGGRGTLVSGVLLFSALGAAAAAAGALLSRSGDWILQMGSRAADMLGRLILAVWHFWQRLFRSRDLSSVTAPEGQSFGDTALPVRDLQAPELMRRVMLGIVAVCMLVIAAMVLWSLLQWLWKNWNRAVRLDGGEDAFVRSDLPRRRLLARLLGGIRVRVFLLRREGTPRAALLWLELWGAAHRCRRRRVETPREYLQRLRKLRLEATLPPAMLQRYDALLADIDCALYGSGQPCLGAEQVRELLAAVRGAQRQT